MSVRETAEEIGIAKSVVRRMKQKIERGAKEAAEGRTEGGSTTRRCRCPASRGAFVDFSTGRLEKLPELNL
jgi:hypothetical protein